MKDFKLSRHCADDLINQVNPSITCDLNWNPEPGHDLLVQKPRRTCGNVVRESSSFSPLRQVLRGYHNELASMHIAHLERP